MIALEVVLESHYWFRSVSNLSSKRSPAMAMSHRWPYGGRAPSDLLSVRIRLCTFALRDDCPPLAMHGGDRQQPV